jgi:hypothetical protein
MSVFCFLPALQGAAGSVHAAVNTFLKSRTCFLKKCEENLNKSGYLTKGKQEIPESRNYRFSNVFLKKLEMHQCGVRMAANVGVPGPLCRNPEGKRGFATGGSVGQVFRNFTENQAVDKQVTGALRL